MATGKNVIDLTSDGEDGDYQDRKPSNTRIESKQSSSSEGKGSSIHSSTKCRKIPKSKDSALSCKICRKKFNDMTTLKRHQLVHREQTLQCPKCPKQFKWQQSLNDHIAAHQNDQVGQLFICPMCSKKFEDEEKLAQHKLQHINSHICYYCPKILGRKYLKRHIRKYHPGLPMNLDGIGPLACTICKKVFVNLKFLKKHAATHLLELPFECAHCGRKFQDKNDIKIHLQKVHIFPEKKNPNGEITTFLCPYCSNKYRERKDLIRHLPTHKNDQQPFQCEICCEKFRLNIELTRHKKKHEAAVLKCRYCGDTLKQKKNLIKHEKRHEEGMQMKLNLTCWFCNLFFFDAEHLEKHMKLIHGDFPGIKVEKNEESQMPQMATLLREIKTEGTENPEDVQENLLVEIQTNVIKEEPSIEIKTEFQ
uniref:C2H2-type domain-containing protein n=2 Tax=Lutzomyia longipalpis TaxID=7200 RepID=A0A1B0GKU1_LUTLO